MKRVRVSNRDKDMIQSGSPVMGEPAFLAVGKLRRSHGLHGEMIMDVLTDFPERLAAGKTVYLGDQHIPKVFRSIRPKNTQLLVAFDGYESPESVGELRNLTVFIRSDELPALPQGEYYFHQIIGLDAVDQTGKVLGKLTDILETGANDVYLIKTPEGKELLLPDIPDVVLAVDLERGTVIVNPPEWVE